MRRLLELTQRNISAPSGTPMMPPITKGSTRDHCSAARNFHTDHPCTIRPKATIKAAAWTGVRTCSHTAAATTPKANPATPVTKAAAVWLHVLTPVQAAALIVAFGLIVLGWSVWNIARRAAVVAGAALCDWRHHRRATRC